MGWSDIVPGAHTRRGGSCVPRWSSSSPGLDLHDVTLAGESLGGALSRCNPPSTSKTGSAALSLFNSYDYPSGLERGNLFARFIIRSVRMPGWVRSSPPWRTGRS